MDLVLTPLRTVVRAGAAVDVLVRGSVRNAQAAAAGIARQREQRHGLAPAPAGSDAPFAQLDRDECLRLLATRSVGRLAYIARAGVPDIVPVNYALLGDDVLIRSGPGPKLQAAERRDTVAFEVDDLHDDSRTGWSVVVVGRAQRVTARELSSVPDRLLPVTWAPGHRSGLIRISPQRIDGRRLSRS